VNPIVHRYDALVAGLAALVSLLALSVSAYATYWQRQQVRAQVWPRLEMGFQTPAFQIHLANVGVGPAEVRAVEVTVDRKAVRDWDALVKALLPPDSHDVSTRASNLNRCVLGPGTQAVLFEIETPAPQKLLSEQLLKGRIGFSFCYCSVLHECWRSSIDRPEDEAVASCAHEPNSFKN
jgi:hypothetical protein